MNGLESLSGLLARIGPRESQMAPNEGFGITFGPPGPDRPQGVPDGSKWMVWNHFAASRPDRLQRAASDLPIMYPFYTVAKMFWKVK